MVMPGEPESESLLKSETQVKDNKDLSKSTGARPKVKSPKEGKRPRFQMKTAKSSTRSHPLESVSEQEEKSAKHALLQSPKDDQTTGPPPRRCPEFFGVRSYVHTFYEAMAMDDPQSYEDIGYDGSGFEGFLTPRKKRKRIRTLCRRACIWSGLILFCFGLLVLLVGFLMPRKSEIVASESDIEIISKSNQSFNKELDICKIIGIVVFCIGGCMIIGVLLILMLTKPNKMDDQILSEDILTMGDDEEPLRSPTDVRVPATEELASVQPKRMEPEEVVMTNAGLCKIPP